MLRAHSDLDRTRRDLDSNAVVLNLNLIAALNARCHVCGLTRNRRPKMKFALIGAAAIAAAAFVSPVLAQDVISNPVISGPSYCVQSYPNANCQNLGPGNPYVYGAYDGGDWRNALAMQALDNNAYRYHGGPKYND
jgi:hypothetical protein